MASVPADTERAAPKRRGPLPARPVELPEYLPARMLNEFVYCPRLFFYEWVEQLFAHSADTVEGALRHEKLERRRDALPPAGEATGERIHSRSVMLASDTHKLIATVDLIEGTEGRVTPVDYKRGRPRDGDDGPEAWDADRAQVCAQALILRDNGYTCDEAVVYYDATKQRVRVPVDDDLVRLVLDAVVRARAVAVQGRIPPPLVDSPKCPRCSLVSICLPDETTAAMYLQDEAAASSQLALFPEVPATPEVLTSGTTPAVRSLVPARDDLRPLYVTGHGFTIGKSSAVLQVRERGKLVQEARLGEISQLNVLGNVQLSAAAVQGLCWAEKPVAHFSHGGWFYGLTQGLGLKNVFLRREQFRRAEDPAFCLRVARQIIASKIRNQRTLLQRNHVAPCANVA
jgi:CRISPR-associated protein Cas1